MYMSCLVFVILFLTAWSIHNAIQLFNVKFLAVFLFAREVLYLLVY